MVILFLVHIKVNFRGHVVFSIQMYSSATFISSSLFNTNKTYRRQHFRGILIVTVSIKNDGHLVFEGHIKVIYFQRH